MLQTRIKETYWFICVLDYVVIKNVFFFVAGTEQMEVLVLYGSKKTKDFTGIVSYLK
jgi:hypothetical protein